MSMEYNNTNTLYKKNYTTCNTNIIMDNNTKTAKTACLISIFKKPKVFHE